MAYILPKTVIEEAFEAWNERDWERFSSYLADDITLVHPRLPEPLKGKEAYVEYDRRLIEAFPDGQCQTKTLAACGNTVVAEIVFKGTHKGQFADFPPTGRQVAIPFVEVFEVTNGRVTEVRRYIDWHTVTQELSRQL